jgi:hypothetical protein
MKKFLFCLFALAASIPASATSIYIVGVPTGWLLESYGATAVTLWQTPSICQNGLLRLPSNASVADNNRLYSTVMAAKLSNARMFIYYDNTAAGCDIISFGLM